MCRQQSAIDAASSRLSLSELRAQFDIPSGPLCDEALERAYNDLSPAIFNHSFRVFLYADWLVKGLFPPAKNATFHTANERELLFVACLFHDMGTTDACNGSCRFEVEGANAAIDLLRKHATSSAFEESSIYQVWLSIALHSTGGIAEHAGRLPMLVRTAVLLDFSEQKRIELQALEEQTKYEPLLPRLDIELVLARAVVKQALETPSKAPSATWPSRLVEAFKSAPPDDEAAQDASLLAGF